MLEPGSKYYLSGNVIGQYSARLYAAAGDQVALIASHGTMSIVEKDGVRFPCKSALLQEQKVDRVPVSDPKPQPIASVPKRAVKKTNKKRNSSLF
jgi:hypothetical protein